MPKESLEDRADRGPQFNDILIECRGFKPRGSDEYEVGPHTVRGIYFATSVHRPYGLSYTCDDCNLTRYQYYAHQRAMLEEQDND